MDFSTSHAAHFLGSSFMSFLSPLGHRSSGTSRCGALQCLGPASDAIITQATFNQLLDNADLD